MRDLDPGFHLRSRYGRRNHGDVPEPDCYLCESFVASLPVRSVEEFLDGFGRGKAVRARRRALAASPAPEPTGLDAIALFVNAATADMYRRMREGERRGWGTSWKTDYPDERVTNRLAEAVEDLDVALRRYRDDTVDIGEVRKRAADVANQAFMLADAARLTGEGS